MNLAIFWGACCFLAWIVLSAWTFDVQNPMQSLYPEILSSGYLLLVVVLFAAFFMMRFQVLVFSRSRKAVSRSWDGLNLLGILTALALIPTPPVVTWAFLTAYILLLVLLRLTLVRWAVLRCYKAEYAQRRETFQQMAKRAVDPESAARMI